MSVWSAAGGETVHAPEPPGPGSQYAAIGDWQGAHYERNAFALGTDQEVRFLETVLDLGPGTTALDVGCGTGRHVRALRGRGVDVIGLDVSFGLLRAGAAHSAAGWVQADARRVPLRDECVDCVLSLCQGGFGISRDGDADALSEMVRVLRWGGRVVLTAFSLAFAARWLVAGEALDVDRGLHWAPADVRGADGQRRRFHLWTQCYSADHLRALAEQRGLAVEGLYGVESGAYGRRAPSLRDPQLLLVARKDSPPRLEEPTRGR